MKAPKWFPKGGSPLRTGTREPPPAMTDVSLRHVGVVRRWPVPAVPTGSQIREPLGQHDSTANAWEIR